MQYLENSFRVLVLGLILGAGLPAVFAVGLRMYAAGTGATDADGTAHRAHPVLKPLAMAVFALVAVVIVVAILWITRNTINHHFGVDLFPFVPKKK